MEVLPPWIGSNRRRRHPLDVFWQYPSAIRPHHKRTSDFFKKHINQAIPACRELEIEDSGISVGFINHSQLRLFLGCIPSCSGGFQSQRMRLIVASIVLWTGIPPLIHPQTASNRSDICSQVSIYKFCESIGTTSDSMAICCIEFPRACGSSTGNSSDRERDFHALIHTVAHQRVVLQNRSHTAP